MYSLNSKFNLLSKYFGTNTVVVKRVHCILVTLEHLSMAINRNLPTWSSTSWMVKLGGGTVIPKPSFLSTRIGRLKPFSSKKDLVMSPPGMRSTGISSPLIKHKRNWDMAYMKHLKGELAVLQGKQLCYSHFCLLSKWEKK